MVREADLRAERADLDSDTERVRCIACGDVAERRIVDGEALDPCTGHHENGECCESRTVGRL